MLHEGKTIQSEKEDAPVRTNGGHRPLFTEVKMASLRILTRSKLSTIFHAVRNIDSQRIVSPFILEVDFYFSNISLASFIGKSSILIFLPVSKVKGLTSDPYRFITNDFTKCHNFTLSRE